MSLSDKDPEETITVTFDFSSASETLTGATWAISAIAGRDDATSSAILDSIPTMLGPLVMQRITGGQDGTTYALRCVASDASGQVLVLTAALKVQTAVPQ